VSHTAGFINRIARNTHCTSQIGILSAHANNKLSPSRPIVWPATPAHGAGLTQLPESQPIFKSFLGRVVYNRFHINLGSKVVSVVSVVCRSCAPRCAARHGLPSASLGGADAVAERTEGGGQLPLYAGAVPQRVDHVLFARHRKAGPRGRREGRLDARGRGRGGGGGGTGKERDRAAAGRGGGDSTSVSPDPGDDDTSGVLVNY
jgi:hypothetical protein